MFESKQEEMVNQGVNITVHRFYQGIDRENDGYALVAYGLENGAGGKYAEAVRAAFGAFYYGKVKEIQGQIDKCRKEDGDAIAKCRDNKQRQVVTETMQRNIDSLKSKLANATHELTKAEVDEALSEGIKKLNELGLKIVAEKCVEKTSFEMQLTYLLYA
jgi:hypothetical protein